MNGSGRPQLDLIDTVVCDIDGVLLLGSQPIPGAREALETMRTAGLHVVLATNNSTRTPSAIRRHVVDVVGFDAGEESVINSGAATARFLRDKVNRVFVLGSPGLRATLAEGGIAVTTDWTEADAVVTGMDFAVGYESFAHAGLAIQNGAAFYATNTDAAYPREDGLYPGAGALTAVVETTTGVSPTVCGKPFAPMRLALEDLGGDQPLIVGDRPDTDIALGKGEGWATVLALTGVIADLELVPSELIPDFVIPSIAALPELLGLENQR